MTTPMTPAQLAIARALVGDGWETDADIDEAARESIAAAAHDVDAAARPLIEAEVRAKLADALQAIADEYYEQVRKGVNEFSGGPIRVASIGDGWTAAARMVRGVR